MFKSITSRILLRWHYGRFCQELQQFPANLTAFSPIPACTTAINTLITKINDMKKKSLYGEPPRISVAIKQPISKDGVKESKCNNCSQDIKPHNASKLVAVKEAHRFMHDCFLAVKTPKKHASAMADVLVASDYCGHRSYGIKRLGTYLHKIETKSIDPAAVPRVTKETAATAWVDGHNALDVVFANYSMDMAIKKGTEVGAGVICAKNSNHSGITMWYPLKAMKHGLIGIAMSNAPSSMMRTADAILNSKPSDNGKGDSFLLDSGGKFLGSEKCQAYPVVALKSGLLLPPSGFGPLHRVKGYSLCALADVLIGILSSSNYSTLLPKRGVPTGGSAGKFGQIYIAFNPNCFTPGFQDHLIDFLSGLRKIEKVSGHKPIITEQQKIKEQSVQTKDQIAYSDEQLRICAALAKRLRVKGLSFK